MKARHLALFVLLLIATGLMIWSRYEIMSIGGKRVASLDRLTGDVTICDETGCVKPPELHQPMLSNADPNPLIQAWDEEQAAKRSTSGE
jgi:hypothetical protein